MPAPAASRTVSVTLRSNAVRSLVAMKRRGGRSTRRTAAGGRPTQLEDTPSNTPPPAPTRGRSPGRSLQLLLHAALHRTPVTCRSVLSKVDASRSLLIAGSGSVILCSLSLLSKVVMVSASLLSNPSVFNRSVYLRQ